MRTEGERTRATHVSAHRQLRLVDLKRSRAAAIVGNHITRCNHEAASRGLAKTVMRTQLHWRCRPVHRGGADSMICEPFGQHDT
jgi:hypothetical protein